jgi:DNA polymerase
VPAGSPDDILNPYFDKPIDWAPGLPLKGAGYTTDYYKKD